MLLKLHRVIIFLAIVIFGVTAYKSHGYYHPDEHYQIIEFARHKLGLTALNDLPWEFKAHVRSSIQPLIVLVLLKAIASFGIEDPHAQMIIIRMLTALLAIYSITFFVKSSIWLISDKMKPFFLLLSYFLWFIPFISVRFSSETVSALFFLLGLGLVIKREKEQKRFYMIGILLGISFLLRYQTAAMSTGLVLWLLFIEKTGVKSILKLIGCLAGVIAVGLILDAIFYGVFEVTFWNYFRVNLMDGVASSFGVSPWYKIFQYLVIDTIWPIGLFMSFSLLLLIRYKPTNVFIWCIAPFVILHSVIPHKELRFMFPLAYLMPIIAVQAAEIFYTHIMDRKNSYLIKGAALAVFVPLLFLNSIGLLINATQPAGDGGKLITRFVYNNSKGRIAKLTYFTEQNPFKPYNDLEENFYAIKSLKFHEIYQINNLSSHLFRNDTLQFLTVKAYYLDSLGFTDKMKALGFKLQIPDQPKWIKLCKRLYGNPSPSKQYILYVKETSPKVKL
jgi:phosphatidylinositol glycan class B